MATSIRSRPTILIRGMSSTVVDELDSYVTTAPMDDVLIKHLGFVLDSAQSVVQDIVGYFAFSPYSFESLHRLSIVLLLSERILRPLLGDSSFTTLFHVTQEGVTDQRIPGDKDQLGFFLAMSLAFLICQRDGSGSAALGNNLAQHFLLIMNFLFSIICLQSLLPMVLWTTVSVIVFRRIGWESTLLVLVFVWLATVLVQLYMEPRTTADV